MDDTPQYDNSGIMFRNTRKVAGSRQPDRRGTATIAGKKYKISGWLRKGRRGEFLTMKFQEDTGEFPAAETQPDGSPTPAQQPDGDGNTTKQPAGPETIF